MSSTREVAEQLVAEWCSSLTEGVAKPPGSITRLTDAVTTALRAHEQAVRAWQPITEATKDADSRNLIGALIDDKGKIWRVALIYWNRIGWYEMNSGHSCHWVTHFMPAPAIRRDDTAAEREG